MRKWKSDPLTAGQYLELLKVNWIPQHRGFGTKARLAGGARKGADSVCAGKEARTNVKRQIHR